VQDFLIQVRKDKQKLIALTVAFAVVAYVDISFIFKAQFKSLNSTSAKAAKLRADLLAVKRDLLVMQQNQGKEKSLGQVKKLVSEGELLSLLENVSEIAKNNGVRVTQINPVKISSQPVKSGQPKSPFLPVQIKLDLICGYHSLGTFINDLENSEYAVSTEDIKISPESTGADLKERVLLTLKTYVKI